MVYQLYLMLVNLVQNKFQSRVIRVMLHGLRLILVPYHLLINFKKTFSTVTDNIKRGTGTYWHIPIY